jgi:hypothetical protein
MVRQKLRGFVGQGVDGKKLLRGAMAQLIVFADVNSGNGSISPRFAGLGLIFAWGAGGGALGGNGSDPGGGGGAALFKLVRMVSRQPISYLVGVGGNAADGTDTIVTLPDGRLLRAGGGKLGVGIAGGLGGQAVGGDLNRAGGAGGGNGSGAAQAGVFGGSFGAAAGSIGGGGGAGGFSDQPHGLSGGSGSSGNSTGNSANGAAPGGGAGGSFATGGIGGPGRFLFIGLRTF